MHPVAGVQWARLCRWSVVGAGVSVGGFVVTGVPAGVYSRTAVGAGLSPVGATVSTAYLSEPESLLEDRRGRSLSCV